jgi:hypothetical protein
MKIQNDIIINEGWVLVGVVVGVVVGGVVLISILYISVKSLSHFKGVPLKKFPCTSDGKTN